MSSTDPIAPVARLRGHMRIETDYGPVLMEFPMSVAPDEIDDLEKVVHLWLRGMKRRSVSPAPAPAPGGAE